MTDIDPDELTVSKARQSEKRWFFWRDVSVAFSLKRIGGWLIGKTFLLNHLSLLTNKSNSTTAWKMKFSIYVMLSYLSMNLQRYHGKFHQRKNEIQHDICHIYPWICKDIMENFTKETRALLWAVIWPKSFSLLNRITFRNIYFIEIRETIFFNGIRRSIWEIHDLGTKF